MDEFVELIDEHGGDIQQVLGDGFMCVFGLRTETGDEALRAVRAGVALVEAAAQQPGRLPAHVGIECGEVLVSPSWEPAGFSIWGRAVTIASRLCDLAGPGTIHIGPRAFELVGPGVGFAPPVNAQLKGTRGDVLVRRLTVGPAPALALAG
jgi:class 3 adenylate cyclase